MRTRGSFVFFPIWVTVLLLTSTTTTTVNCNAASAIDASRLNNVTVNTSGVPTLEECVFSNAVSFESLELAADTGQRCNTTHHSKAGLSDHQADPVVSIATNAEEELHGAKEELQAIQDAVREVLPSTQRNFALEKDGAKVLAANPGAKKPSGVLDDDSDTFMRNDCRDDKWLVIELSQVAKVSRIDVAQYELYSSRLKEFEVRGRQSHPRTDDVDTAKGLNSTAWKVLGRWTAERVKGTQEFSVDNPPWVRFMLFRFLSHYGNEPVCAVNGISVYGKSAAEELEAQLAEEGALEDLAGIANPTTSEQKATKTNLTETDADEVVDHSNGQSKVIGKSGVSTENRGMAPLANESSMKNVSGTKGTNNTVQNEFRLSRNDGNLSNTEEKQRLYNKHGIGDQEGKNGDASIAKDKADFGLAALELNVSINNRDNETSIQNDNITTEQISSIADLLEEVPIPKAKAGSGMYEVLVQEIRSSRAQQRMMAKALDALQRNITMLANELERSRREQEEIEIDATIKIESLIAARIGMTHVEVRKLQRALKASAQREIAGWALLAVVFSSLVLNVISTPRSGRSWLYNLVILLLAAHSLLVIFYLLNSGGLWPRAWGGKTILALPGPQ